MYKCINALLVSLFLLTSCVWNTSSSIILHPKKIGICTVRFHDSSRERPLITEIWYPIEDRTPAENVQGLWLRCAEARDAPVKVSKKKYPLIVMSHGNGGDRMNNSWLAEILASNGYIVASMDHHGNTWNNKIPENYIKIWERPQDVSFIVDQLLQHEQFGSHIRHNKIGFIGYSLGGQTGIWIAGGQIPEFGKPVIDKIPTDQLPAALNDIILDSIDYSPALKSYKDARISAVFVMAPALGYLFDLTSLQAITVPVHIVASEGDNVTPLDTSANILASKIGKAAFTLIPGNANHYVFLNEVTKGGKLVLDKHLALDPPNVDRSRIHEDIGHSAVKFFDYHLK